METDASLLDVELEQKQQEELYQQLLLQSLNFQKMAIESRLSGRSNSLLPPGQSFLAQQRQVTNARHNMPINVPATSSK